MAIKTLLTYGWGDGELLEWQPYNPHLGAFCLQYVAGYVTYGVVVRQDVIDNTKEQLTLIPFIFRIPTNRKIQNGFICSI